MINHEHEWLPHDWGELCECGAWRSPDGMIIESDGTCSKGPDIQTGTDAV